MYCLALKTYSDFLYMYCKMAQKLLTICKSITNSAKFCSTSLFLFFTWRIETLLNGSFCDMHTILILLQGDASNLRLTKVCFRTLSSHFFVNYMNIFHKTEVQTIILRCWTGSKVMKQNTNIFFSIFFQFCKKLIICVMFFAFFALFCAFAFFVFLS